MKPNWHRFECLGLSLLYDTASGSLHSLDQVGWDILQGVEEGTPFDADALVTALSTKHPPESIREVFVELHDLFVAGEIGAEDIGLEFEPNLDPDRPIKALCLHIAHACNITCGYCFASSGTFGGERVLMSPDTAKAAIDFLLASSKGRKHCEIDFFGGEPLTNWQTVKEAVLYGEARAIETGKEIKFTLTTNGIALDEYIMDFLDEHRIAIVLSIDGRKETNDRMRCFFDGDTSKSVYESIVPKFQSVAARRPGQGYYVRGTFTRYNLDFFEDVKHLVSLGFDQVSVEPVIGMPSDDYTLKEDDVPGIFAEYEKLASWLIERKRAGEPINFFHYNLELERGPCIAKRVSGCGAGNEYLAVTPKGELYPCHQFVGREEFKLGDIAHGVIKSDARDVFGKANLISKPVCRGCWARYFCGGGCHANAHLANGDIMIPFGLGCDLQKKRIECGLAMYAALALE